MPLTVGFKKTAGAVVGWTPQMTLRATAFLSVAIVLLSLSAPACSGDGDASPVIVKINDSKIQRAEFDQFLTLKMGELTAAETLDLIRSQMLDEYIQRRLVLAEATRANLSITDEEIEQATVENPQIKSSASSEQARRELVNDLLIAKYYRQVVLADVQVSTDEVQQYLNANNARLAEQPTFYVREIRVETKEEADSLFKEVTEARRDFAEVARLHSHAPTAEQGGLGRYSEGQLPAVLDKTIAALRPGDISPVVQSTFGYHIFKLERRVQAHAPDERRALFDERRSNLIEELIARKNQEAVDRALEAIVSSARIHINDSALGFTYVGRLRHN